MIAVDDDALDRARRLRKSGANWNEIERATGISLEKLRRRLEPGYAVAQNAKSNARWKAANRGADRKAPHPGSSRANHYGVNAAEAAYRLSLVPPDTRTLSARLMGEPLFERSALYKRQQEQRR